jgi:hypothetical protein
MPRIWSRIKFLLASEIVTTRMTDAFPMIKPRPVRKVRSRLACSACKLKLTASARFSD